MRYIFALLWFGALVLILLSSGCASGGYAESSTVWRGSSGSIDYHRWAMRGRF